MAAMAERRGGVRRRHAEGGQGQAPALGRRRPAAAAGGGGAAAYFMGLFGGASATAWRARRRAADEATARTGDDHGEARPARSCLRRHARPDRQPAVRRRRACAISSCACRSRSPTSRRPRPSAADAAGDGQLPALPARADARRGPGGGGHAAAEGGVDRAGQSRRRSRRRSARSCSRRCWSSDRQPEA